MVQSGWIAVPSCARNIEFFKLARKVHGTGATQCVGGRMQWNQNCTDDEFALSIQLLLCVHYERSAGASSVLQLMLKPHCRIRIGLPWHAAEWPLNEDPNI